ncbi:MAG TPA: 5-oxoprolinase subunit PxpA [Chthoniobacteraceae bacterium]|nr:5-oxoprolinase subunit PxpA [Chthoniobacteraceae bacterium]
MQAIDLNCDLGEGAGHDAALMPLITSANIACGGHAGDAATMRETMMLALQSGAAIGAHPGFADRGNFGRRERAVTSAEVRELIVTQLGALWEVADSLGAKVRHVKPHGALYNMAARDPVLAGAIASAISSVDSELVLFGLAGSELIRTGQTHGLHVANEVFADRTYQPDGSLTPRAHPKAMIEDGAAVIAQVLQVVRTGTVTAVNGELVPVKADTVCLHGDGVHAVAFANRLRAALENAGIRVRATASR